MSVSLPGGRRSYTPRLTCSRQKMIDVSWLVRELCLTPFYHYGKTLGRLPYRRFSGDTELS